MKSINPDPKRLPEIFSNIPKDKSVIVINLLKFRDKAKYPDDRNSCSGREAYGTYSDAASKVLKKIGAQVFWRGKVHGCLIAPEGEDWDEALLVKYPSIKVFMGMLEIPEYRECTIHRTAALEDSRLIATIEK